MEFHMAGQYDPADLQDTPPTLTGAQVASSPFPMEEQQSLPLGEESTAFTTSQNKKSKKPRSTRNSTRPTRKRAARACAACRARKVRCEMNEADHECRNCYWDRITCIMQPSRRRKRTEYTMPNVYMPPVHQLEGRANTFTFNLPMRFANFENVETAGAVSLAGSMVPNVGGITPYAPQPGNYVEQMAMPLGMDNVFGGGGGGGMVWPSPSAMEPLETQSWAVNFSEWVDIPSSPNPAIPLGWLNEAHQFLEAQNVQQQQQQHQTGPEPEG